jgi:hypothetical protein
MKMKQGKPTANQRNLNTKKQVKNLVFIKNIVIELANDRHDTVRKFPRGTMERL